ncbi:F-box protein CPR1-like isoform X1 [Papaver somniferum]|uniref:F-box protein CPR1-like isoform X1 n=1 Tax=Papaver somniferum TaxID=3469 RepID=UPI000E6FEF17|nr:F-box protein CPR1-like isoform X1 [Papaver somniferum]
MSVSSRTRSKLKQRDEAATSLLLNLPEEVHDEIFLKLPGKSILVSRCVCKLFYNLLSKPNFIKNHLNRTNQSKNSNPKLLFSQSSGGMHPLIYSVPVDYPSISSPPPSDGAVLISYPIESTRNYLFEFWGSCNGLICSRILSIDRPSQNRIILESKFCVLNPLTREFKEFKEPENCNGGVTYGFGEIMVNMPLPENIMPRTDYSGKVYKNVAVWGDCIGITCIWGSVKIDVWVMQEYGVKESWIKKYTTTQLPSRAQEILFWRPLWCFSNSEILIDTGGRRLFLYEPTTERVRLVLVHDFIMSNSRQSYVESIVSLGSATYLEKRITDEIVKYSK